MRSSLFSRLCVAALALAVAGGFAGTALGAETIRFGHDQQKSHAYQIAGEIVAAQLPLLTKQAYEVRVFPGATLGHEMAMLDSVIAGNLDMSIAAASNAATFLPFMGMFSVSYLFENAEHFKRALNDEKFTRIVDEKIAKANAGFRRIAWFTAGVRNVYNNKRAIRTVDDLQNIKMRVMASPIESKVWSTIGTKPLSIPFGDVYTGMQTKLVEAAENAAAVYGANKHYEVAPFYSLTEHQWLIACIYMSDKSWNKLPKPVQEYIVGIGRGMTNQVTDFAVQTDSEFVEMMQQKYNVKVNKVEKKPFMDRLSPLQDQVAKDLGMEAALARIRELR